jgi:hypothetical protein
MRQRGLAQAGQILDEQMAAGKQGDKASLTSGTLPSTSAFT